MLSGKIIKLGQIMLPESEGTGQVNHECWAKSKFLQNGGIIMLAQQIIGPGKPKENHFCQANHAEWQNHQAWANHAS
jgi:hypothetical protein